VTNLKHANLTPRQAAAMAKRRGFLFYWHANKKCWILRRENETAYVTFTAKQLSGMTRATFENAYLR